MANERIYISSQLACMLEPRVFKVLFYLVSWQSMPQFKYYPKQMSKALHMDVEIIELAIQTLIDRKLVSASRVDEKWLLTLEKEEIDRYLKVPLEKVSESSLFPIADKVLWNVEKTQQKASESDLEGISDDQLEKLVLELQRRRNQKKGCQVIYANAVTNNDDFDNLPF